MFWADECDVEVRLDGQLIETRESLSRVSGLELRRRQVPATANSRQSRGGPGLLRGATSNVASPWGQRVVEDGAMV